MKTVAIVGAESHTRHLAPYQDKSIDIWCFNQALGSKFAKRISALFQIHNAAIYKDPTNPFDPRHLELLKQKHKFPVYMLEADPDVPNSVRYPLQEILNFYPQTEKKMFTQSTCYALALALYLGYERVMLYGIENAHYSEYSSEREGFIYWVSFLQGYGVKVERHCGDNMFIHPLYGREKQWTQDPKDYAARLVELELLVRKTTRKLQRVAGKEFEKWNLALYNLGAAEGMRVECEKFKARIDAMVEASGQAILVPSELEIDGKKIIAEMQEGRNLMEQARGAHQMRPGKENLKAYAEAALYTSKLAGRYQEIKRMMKLAEDYQLKASEA